MGGGGSSGGGGGASKSKSYAVDPRERAIMAAAKGTSVSQKGGDGAREAAIAMSSMSQKAQKDFQDRLNADLKAAESSLSEVQRSRPGDPEARAEWAQKVAKAQSAVSDIKGSIAAANKAQKDAAAMAQKAAQEKAAAASARETAIAKAAQKPAPSKPAPAPAMSRPTAVAKPSPAPAPTPAMSRPTAVAKPSPAPASKPAVSKSTAVDARETAIAKAAGAKPDTGQMHFGGSGKAFTPVTTDKAVVTKPAQQIKNGEVVQTFDDVRTTGERMAAGQTGLQEGTTFAFNKKGEIVGKVVEKPVAMPPPALAIYRKLTGQTDTLYQKTYTGKTSEPVSVGFKSEKMAGDIGTSAGAPTAAAMEKKKAQETMGGATEPLVTPEVTPEVVPDETVLGQAAAEAQDKRRRTRYKRVGGASSLIEGYGALYK